MYNPISAEFAEQYRNSFRITRTTTTELKNPETLAKYKNDGFLYIRKLNYNYNKIMREPTVGCYVELSFLEEVGSFQIDSPRARKLINRLSYF